MYEYQGMGYLKNLLRKKRDRVDLRYKYYEMKNVVRDLALTAGNKLGRFDAVLGWCPKAVDSLSDRLIFKGWKDDLFNIESIFRMNNADVFFDSAIISALIGGCSFIYVSLDEEGFPRLEVIDGRDATGIVDPVTNLLREGYAVLERDPKTGHPTTEAYFQTGLTTIISRGEIREIPNAAPAPLLVPVIYRPDAKRPLGHSRISRASMSILRGAARTVKRSEVSAEFYSFPQKYVVGMSGEDIETVDNWKAAISKFLMIEKDDISGDKPTIGQFQQASMSPFSEQLRTFASLFAGENGLTLDDLGFVSDNPSSAEAIKASHETLRLTARKAQRTFGTCFLNVGFVACCLRDEKPYLRRQFYLTTPVWEPIFEPDAATLSSIGDGAIKLNQAVPGYFNTDNLPVLTGIEPSAVRLPFADEE